VYFPRLSGLPGSGKRKRFQRASGRAGAADFQTVSDGNMRHSVSTDSVSANDVFCKMYDMKMYFDQCFTFRIDR